MKTTISLAILFTLIGVLSIRGTWVNRDIRAKSIHAAGFEFPPAVKAIIDKKCYYCHSTQGKSSEAKKDLMWDSIPNYNKAKQIAKLDDIVDVLDQGKMPPKKMLDAFPDAKLSPEELKMLRSWADATADSLMK